MQDEYIRSHFVLENCETLTTLQVNPNIFFPKPFITYHIDLAHLLSSFLMIIITVLGSSMVIPSGNESTLIVRVKFSLPSSTSSSYIMILNDILVTPAENVTLYGPDP